ncbi:hypothetical protein mRhiFer1_008333 [Rhinolophus ferrumequinum]|uniref:Uncharacterized protein n=1 Tax=Rhinolophus ferrumequinum TaxID=59479 RepID=A0A7J7VE99_RHIFE|nr:hypothetical protein mRhiFer1_008333 [Rhinolophus ferrumequinum]
MGGTFLGFLRAVLWPRPGGPALNSAGPVAEASLRRQPHLTSSLKRDPYIPPTSPDPPQQAQRCSVPLWGGTATKPAHSQRVLLGCRPLRMLAVQRSCIPCFQSVRVMVYFSRFKKFGLFFFLFFFFFSLPPHLLTVFSRLHAYLINLNNWQNLI